nr:leucine-rich repeat extensin-like protein 5 [Chrysemys picta bellii]
MIYANPAPCGAGRGNPPDSETLRSGEGPGPLHFIPWGAYRSLPLSLRGVGPREGRAVLVPPRAAGAGACLHRLRIWPMPCEWGREGGRAGDGLRVHIMVCWPLKTQPRPLGRDQRALARCWQAALRSATTSPPSPWQRPRLWMGQAFGEGILPPWPGLSRCSPALGISCPGGAGSPAARRAPGPDAAEGYLRLAPSKPLVPPPTRASLCTPALVHTCPCILGLLFPPLPCGSERQRLAGFPHFSCGARGPRSGSWPCCPTRTRCARCCHGQGLAAGAFAQPRVELLGPGPLYPTGPVQPSAPKPTLHVSGLCLCPCQACPAPMEEPSLAPLHVSPPQEPSGHRRSCPWGRQQPPSPCPFKPRELRTSPCLGPGESSGVLAAVGWAPVPTSPSPVPLTSHSAGSARV